MENPDYVAPPAAGTNDTRNATQKAQWIFFKPKEKKPAMFLEGSCGGASFFVSIHVSINGFPVEHPSTGLHHYYWQTFNRVFMSSKHRQEKYGELVPRVSCETHLKTTGELSDDLKNSMDSLDFDTALESKSKAIQFSFDNVFPFDVSICCQFY
jgi:hypothetical protein